MQLPANGTGLLREGLRDDQLRRPPSAGTEGATTALMLAFAALVPILDYQIVFVLRTPGACLRHWYLTSLRRGVSKGAADACGIASHTSCGTCSGPGLMLVYAEEAAAPVAQTPFRLQQRLTS